MQFESPVRQLVVNDSYKSFEYMAFGKSLRSVENLSWIMGVEYEGI